MTPPIPLNGIRQAALPRPPGRSCPIWRNPAGRRFHVPGQNANGAGASSLPGLARRYLWFLFQPAEELGPGPVPSGAKAMMEAKVLDNPKVDVVMGQHISARAPGNTLAYRAGSFMASGDVFNIKLQGKGGHGSSPWTAKDPTLTAAEIVLALQGIISQQIDPLDGPTVVTVGLLQSGNRVNILPDTAEIGGTVRSLSARNQKVAHDSIRLKAEKIAESAGLTAEVTIDTGKRR